MQTRTDQLKSMPVDADTPLHHHVSVFRTESETARTERQSDVQIHRSSDISDKLYFIRSDQLRVCIYGHRHERMPSIG